jgi:Xaa-Pro aminopeptidase
VRFDLAAIQAALADDGLDGWLWFDFHGSNPIALQLAGLEGRHVTRRWFYLIRSSGEPHRLVHAIEPGVLDAFPGRTTRYAGHGQLRDGLGAMLRGLGKVAMEYSPQCAIPYVSRVDAGTVELVRSCGVEVVSSGDLVGRFEAAWDEAAHRSHRLASEALYRIKDRTFEFLATQLRARVPVAELEVQARMKGWFLDEGLVTDADPIVAVQEHAGDPHYAPVPSTSRLVGDDEVVLIDLWGKLPQPGSVYADITWTGVTGAPGPGVTEVFEVVVAARDAAVAAVERAWADNRPVRGYEVDRAARGIISAAGFGESFVHRTGHSLGTHVHGNGVNMDDYETHDTRRLLPGTGFTIEPGIYRSDFGIRSEINLVMTPAGPVVSGPRQRALVALGGVGGH